MILPSANKLRLSIAKYSFLETAVLLFGFTFIGYYIDPADPLLLHYEIIFIIATMAIITLFHGISEGILAIFILVVEMHFLYPVFPVEFFLKISLFTLVFGEFHYFWNRKIAQNRSKNAYLRNKLDELTNAFYMLKISHDQLEKNYLFKPMSLRNSIRKLKESYSQNNDYFKEFSILLEKSFNVSKSQLCIVNDSKLYSPYDKEYLNPLDIKDPMIEMVFVKKSPMYVSSQEMQNNSKYLAVIPAVSANKVKGVLLIEKMPFLSFNKDTLITISVIISYFLDEVEKWNFIESSKNENCLIQDEYIIERGRLYKLYNDYKVESTILVIKTKDELLSHLILEAIYKTLRSLDIVSNNKSNDYEVITILFPFADQASANGFLTRLFKLIKLKIDDEKVEYSYFNISELEIINQYSELG